MVHCPLVVVLDSIYYTYYIYTYFHIVIVLVFRRTLRDEQVFVTLRLILDILYVAINMVWQFGPTGHFSHVI